MSSTNHTANYGLSQFLGTDKPAWLVDYNGDMSAIDTQMKANADAAAAAQSTANTADGKADTNASAITTLNTQINGDSGIAADVTTLQGSVNTITSLIGNGEPTTTDKTLIGAINELHSDMSGNRMLKNITGISVTADGVKTLGELIDDLYAIFSANVASLSASDIIVPLVIYGNAVGAVYQNIDNATYVLGGGAPSGSFTFNSLFIDTANSAMAINELVFKSSTSTCEGVASTSLGTTSTTYTSNVITAGNQIGLTYYTYTLV